MGPYLVSHKELIKYQIMEADLKKMAKVLKCDIFDVAKTVEKNLKRIKALEKDVKRLNLFIGRRI